jgi:soluble lytic murein transglycosylase-like protein
MATYSIFAPQTGLQSPKTWYGMRTDLSKEALAVYKRYEEFIKFTSSATKIPVPILLSFIMVESNGNPNAGGSSSVTQGLMQWNRNFAKDQLEYELKEGRLSPAEKTKLAQFGIKFDAKGKTRIITNADQIKPELNILIGGIILGQLMDEKWASTNGALRLDRVIAVYNAGAFGETGKKARLGNHPNAAALAKDVNTITRAYINKIMGRDGALDVITTDLKGSVQQA